MRMKRRTRVLALVMSMLMMLTSPMQALAEGEAANQAGDYLGEVYVAVAKTADEAAKALEDKGYAVLKGDDGKPADLNQGAGSALKEDRAVVLGYKTTGERAEAITDLAVMGMDGGYSFSDYATLMAKYRDSQIRPLIERFMATVREYRENASSENAGNRARAEAARELLNHVVDDDSGGRLGDMLLNQTMQELGIDTSSMAEEQARAERAAHPANLDLECALMQGNVDVILLVEQLVSMASDAGETSWLERLSALGPDGLAAAYGDARPTDAAQGMAASYQDTAKRVAAGWEPLRKLLLDYDATVAKDEAGQSAPDESQAAEGDDVADPGYEFPTVESSSDAGTLEISVESAEHVVESVSKSLENAAELAEQANNAQQAALYWYLRSMPYGEGTLFDLFARPVEDVSANGYEALYPLASVLTPGQVAGLEFLPLTTMAVNGAASGEAFEAMGPGCGGVLDKANKCDISLYANVNRELFSDKVALTSEALRRGTVETEWTDLLSLRNFAILSWVGTAVSGVAALATARRAAPLSTKMTSLTTKRTADAALMKGVENTYNELKEMSEYYPESSLWSFKVEKVPSTNGVNQLKATVISYDKARMPLRSESRYFDATTSGLSVEMNDLERAKNHLSSEYNKLDSAISSTDKEIEGLQSRISSANRARYVTAGIFAVLAIASIALTAIDVYNYYNVKMTPIPKYIVDVEDITATAEDGTTTVVRNDSAYYQVARTDSARDGDVLAAMEDYADLNGDKGKGWLALYSVKSDAKEPILASSLRVVTGTSSVPDGYEAGIHEFGSDSAANLTDSRYSYNDDANGVYAYFKREATAAPAAASAFAGGNTALVAGVSLVAGAALGAGGMYLAGRRRREPVAA